MYLVRQKKTRWLLNGRQVKANTPGAKKTIEVSPYYTVVIPLPGKAKKKVTLKGVTSKEVAMQYLLKMRKEGVDSLLGLKGTRPDAEDFKIDKLLELFLKTEKAKGNSPAYYKGMHYYLDSFFRELPEVYLRQLTTEMVTSHLQTKVSRKNKPWSSRARNYCRQFLVRFGRWCKKQRFWKKNLFKNISTFKGLAVKVRRPLSLKDFRKLVRGTGLRPFFQAQPKKKDYKNYLVDKAWERRLLYYFLFTVVSRLGAALELRVGHLNFTESQPTVSFPAGNVKKRRMIVKPIPVSMAKMLKDWIAHKKLKAEDKVFSLSKTLTRDFYKDLDFARIPRKYPDGTSVDIHSLKTSAISFLGSRGIEGKLLRDIGEHEKLETTYGHYLTLGVEDYQRVSGLFEQHVFRGGDAAGLGRKAQ